MKTRKSSYKKVYLDYFDYGEQDYIPSEISGSPANDIHHICYRSQLGKDNIENLIALTREEHNLVHAKKLSEEYLIKVHKQFINERKKHTNDIW